MIMPHNKKKISNAWFVVAMLAYTTALLCYISEGSFSSNVIAWGCLGSAFLCLGATYLHKENKDSEKNDPENKDKL